MSEKKLGNLSVWLRWTIGWIVWSVALAAVESGVRAAAFSASVDRTAVELGESFLLSLKFTDARVNSPPRLPEIPGADVEYRGASQGIQIINGVRRSSVTFQYEVTPKAVGEVLIPGLQISLGNQPFQSDPISVTVTAPNTTAAPGGAKDQPAFLVLNCPTNAYYGEALPVEVKLFFLVAPEPGVPQLAVDGFVLGKIPQPESGTSQVNGQRYGVVTWRLTATAVKAGKLEFGPAELEAILKFPSKRRDPFGFGGGVFDDFFAERRRVVLKSETQVIDVSPLPTAGRPGEFQGGVGQFSMRVEVSPTNVLAGDPMTLRVRVKGEGNFEQLGAPVLVDSQGFKTYEARGEFQPSDPIGLRGEKVFEQVVVPEVAGTRVFPEVRLAYFNPKAKRYETLRHPSTRIEVRASTAGQAAPSRATGANVDAMAPVRTASVDGLPPARAQLGASGLLTAPWVLRPAVLAALATPAPVYWMWRAWRRRRDRREQDPEFRRQRDAANAEQEAWSAVLSAAEKMEHKTLIDALAGWVRLKVGCVLGFSAAGRTDDELLSCLRKAGVVERNLKEVAELMEELGQARYSPSTSPRQLSELRLRAERVRGILESMEVR